MRGEVSQWILGYMAGLASAATDGLPEAECERILSRLDALKEACESADDMYILTRMAEIRHDRDCARQSNLSPPPPPPAWKNPGREVPSS